MADVYGVHIDFNDNSVNIEAGQERNCHQGDLRSALVQAGLKLLDERNGDEIGLREVAQVVRGSPTAVYRHLPDRAALLCALK